MLIFRWFFLTFQLCLYVCYLCRLSNMMRIQFPHSPLASLKVFITLYYQLGMLMLLRFVMRSYYFCVIICVACLSTLHFIKVCICYKHIPRSVTLIKTIMRLVAFMGIPLSSSLSFSIPSHNHNCFISSVTILYNERSFKYICMFSLMFILSVFR